MKYVLVLIVAGLVLLAYTGVEPFASAKDTITWKLQETTGSTATPQSKVATVERISALEWPVSPYYRVVVEVVPLESAIAGRSYYVDLYEKGQFRQTSTVEWNQPELNIASCQKVVFPLTKEEGLAYAWKDVSNVFTATVHD